MSDIRWGDMEPATQAHLTLLSKMSGGITCGCTHKGNDYWWLCQYHSGMDDGAEATAAENERLREELSDTTMRLGRAEADRDAHMAEVERLERAVQRVRDLCLRHPSTGTVLVYLAVEDVLAALDGERDE